MADRSDIIRRRLLRARRQPATEKTESAPAKAEPVPARAVSIPAKVAPPQAPIKQSPSPPTAPKAPKGKIEREKKLMKLSCARRAQFLKYFMGLIILGAGGYVYLFRPIEFAVVSAFVSFDYIASALVLLGIVIILYAEAKGRGANYYITQYRIVESWGLLRKREHGLQLPLVESVKIHQTFFQRILGIGDVELKTSGGDKLKILKVGNPSKVESLILSELNRSAGAKTQQPRGA